MKGPEQNQERGRPTLLWQGSSEEPGSFWGGRKGTKRNHCRNPFKVMVGSSVSAITQIPREARVSIHCWRE